jgi:hypothetical protein
MVLDDQALALSYMRDIIIVNSKQSSPENFLTLPRILATFPCLRRCTLLFGVSTPERNCKDTADDVEWVTAAFVSGRPVPLEMQGHMASIGMPRHFRLEEAMGPHCNWQQHRKIMEANVYPTFQVRSNLLRARESIER